MILVHPLIKNILQYFGIGLGGLILEFVFFTANRNLGKNLEEQISENNKVINISSNKNRTTVNSLKLINNDILIENKKVYKKNIFLVFFCYYFGKMTISSLDSLGFHQTKYWPLEFLALFYFSKKILKMNIYKHQIWSLSIVLIFSTLLYFINSFIPESNKECDPSDAGYDGCKLLRENVYMEIIEKLGSYFIPLIIFFYLLAMTSDAYASISYKWFMDFKFISMYKISIYIGIIGVLFSLIILLIVTFIPCSEEKEFIKYVCQFKYSGRRYYDSFKFVKEIAFNYKFFIELFVIIPLFMILNLLFFYFNLLIINYLDPFYLIPIDTCYYIIYQTIDFLVTLEKANKMNNIRFVLATLSDLICVLCCSVYLEIVELNFCSLNKNIRRNIIKRGVEEQINSELVRPDINSKQEENEDDVEFDMNDSFNKIEDNNYYIYLK